MAECTIYDKLRYILDTKDLIKAALISQDVEVLESDAFRKYAEYITEIRKVSSVNGQTGDIVLKTINGINLVGEGNITVEGGSGGGTTVDLTNYYTKEEIDNIIEALNIPSLDGYATEQWVSEQGYLKTIPDTYVTDEELSTATSDKVSQTALNEAIQGVEAKIPTVVEYTAGVGISITEDNVIKPDFTVMASKEWIDSNYYNNANTYTKEEVNALIDGVNSGDVDLTNYYTKEEVDEKIPDVSNYALKSEIPSLSGYATEQWVEDKKYLTEHQDLSNYALKSEIPSLSGYATEQWVGEQGYLTEHQSLEDYAKKTDIPDVSKFITEEDIPTIPTKTSELTNDSGFITLSEVPKTDLNGYATEQWVEDKGYLTEHQQLKTINGESIVGEGNITIEGGSGSVAGVESIDVGGVYLNGKLSFSTSTESSDNSWRVGLQGEMYDSTTDEYYGNGGTLIFGVKSSDNSIIITDGGSLADLTINPDILSGSSSGGDAPTLQEGVSGTTSNYIYSDGDQNSNNCVLASAYVDKSLSPNSIILRSNVKLWGSDSASGKHSITIYGADEHNAGVMTSEDKIKLDALVANSGSTSGGATYTAGDGISISEDNTITNTGVTAINIGNTIEDWTQKTGIVKMATSWYDGRYEVQLDGTSFFGIKPLDSSIILENAGGTVNGNTVCGIKVNEWIGTQSEYNALESYDDNCTYNIIEG